MTGLRSTSLARAVPGRGGRVAPAAAAREGDAGPRNRRRLYKEFPRLQRLADTDDACAVLARHLGRASSGGAITVTDFDVRRLYYTPGVGCRSLFEVMVDDGKTGQPVKQIFFGKTFLAKSTKAMAAAARRRTLARPRLGPPVFHVPEWDMVVWAYPNDPDLPGLPVMSNARHVLVRARSAPHAFGLVHAPHAIAAQMTKYVPGKRCGYVYRFQGDAPPSTGGTSSPPAVYGKAYCGAEGEAAYRIVQEIWCSEACRDGGLLLPQPYGYDATHKIVWQEAVSGRPLAKTVATLSSFPDVAAEIGRRLAAFHGSALELPAGLTTASHVRDLKSKLRAVVRAFPEHADRLRGLGTRTLRGLGQLAPAPAAPVHGSFKFSHIFQTARGTTFIDFDGAYLGDPADDLGRFTAHLYRIVAKGRIPRAVAVEGATRFREAYERAARVPVAADRIGWFTVSHLIRSELYHLVKRAAPGPVAALVDIAEDLCPGRGRARATG
jgi:hypothetical protein